jgi:hypothetical protein
LQEEVEAGVRQYKLFIELKIMIPFHESMFLMDRLKLYKKTIPTESKSNPYLEFYLNQSPRIYSIARYSDNDFDTFYYPNVYYNCEYYGLTYYLFEDIIDEVAYVWSVYHNYKDDDKVDINSLFYFRSRIILVTQIKPKSTRYLNMLLHVNMMYLRKFNK